MSTECKEGALFKPLNRSGLRLSLPLIIALSVITSPMLMLLNPTLAEASTSPKSTDPTSFSVPSTIVRNGGGSDFTSQAPLLGPATFRSTDLVSSTAIYEIQFITTTTGVIDKIDITFPAGTVVAFAGIIERVGITGPASITKSGTTVTLNLNTPVSVPAGTFVRLEMVDLINPPNPANYKISVTTRDASNVPIDGPSLSPAYTIRQVSTGMIANNAVTTSKIATGAITTPQIADGAISSTKPAESFMKRVTVHDDDAGHAVLWDPNGVSVLFTISEPAAGFVDDTFVTAYVRGVGIPPDCRVTSAGGNAFELRCESAPANGADLHYVVENLPPHVTQ